MLLIGQQFGVGEFVNVLISPAYSQDWSWASKVLTGNIVFTSGYLCPRKAYWEIQASIRFLFISLFKVPTYHINEEWRGRRVWEVPPNRASQCNGSDPCCKRGNKLDAIAVRMRRTIEQFWIHWGTTPFSLLFIQAPFFQLRQPVSSMNSTHTANEIAAYHSFLDLGFTARTPEWLIKKVSLWYNYDSFRLYLNHSA